MRLALSVVALCLLAACDSSGLDVPLPPPPSAGIDTLGAVRLDARATYLRIADDPGATAAVPVALSSLGAAAGDEITFFVSGYASLDPTDPNRARSRDVVAVFAASSAMDAPDVRRRVRDAVEAGTDFATDSTAIGRQPTDIDEDFFATRATVIVPASATHLFLALHDGFYTDNTDVGEGVLVTVLRRR